LRQLPTIGPLMLSLAERALAFERLANVHRQAAQGRTPAEFAERALDSLQVRFQVDPAQVERIPVSGPAIVVVVDLLRIDQRALLKYMGRDQALAYLAHERASVPVRPAA
jgi:hypothetical protein